MIKSAKQVRKFDIVTPHTIGVAEVDPDHHRPQNDPKRNERPDHDSSNRDPEKNPVLIANQIIRTFDQFNRLYPDFTNFRMPGGCQYRGLVGIGLTHQNNVQGKGFRKMSRRPRPWYHVGTANVKNDHFIPKVLPPRPRAHHLLMSRKAMVRSDSSERGFLSVHSRDPKFAAPRCAAFIAAASRRG